MQIEKAILRTLISERDLAFFRMVADGRTLQSIADEHGITRQRVAQIVGKVGVKKPPDISWAEETIRSMHADGYTFPEIAEIVGISAQVIRVRLGLRRVPKRITHGTRTGYNRGCRCEECKRVNALAAREAHAQRRRRKGMTEMLDGRGGKRKYQ